MKKICGIVVCGLLGACSSTNYVDTSKLPNTELMVDRVVPTMTRTEMINAILDCEGAGTRPVVITTRRKINGFLTEAPVEVTCMPKYIK